MTVFENGQFPINFSTFPHKARTLKSIKTLCKWVFFFFCAVLRQPRLEHLLALQVFWANKKEEKYFLNLFLFQWKHNLDNMIYFPNIICNVECQVRKFLSFCVCFHACLRLNGCVQVCLCVTFWCHNFVPKIFWQTAKTNTIKRVREKSEGEGERWGKKESKRKKENTNKQRREKTFAFFYLIQWDVIIGWGCVAILTLIWRLFHSFRTFYCWIYSYRYVCVSMCVLCLFLWVQRRSQNVPLKLAPAYDAARACVSVYRMHTVNIISEFWVATLFPIRQTSKLNSFFCSLRCDVMFPCNANAFTWKQFWYANIKMIWINWIVISIFDFKRMSSYLNENVHEMCVILIDVSVSKCLYGRKKK